MSNLKAGDLCLIVGSDYHKEDIGKSGLLLKLHKKEDLPNAEDLENDVWELSCVKYPKVSYEKHLMKISGHKEPEKLKVEEGIEA